MGNILFCPKCENENTAKNESVIRISDNCIDRLTNDEKKDGKNADAVIELEDDDWIKKLKCIDDIHSNQNGLTMQAVEALIKTVESEIGTIRPQICSTEAKNHNCMIKCKHLIDGFIDCVDKSRIDIMKEKVEEEERCRILEEQNELAQEFLK